MPYVSPKDANNKLQESVADIKDRNKSPPWRERIAASGHFRIVLLCWLPGQAHKLHHHPEADEIMIIWEGKARFIFDGKTEIIGEPGDVLVAPVGVAHEVTAIGDKPLLMLAIVTPNRPNDEVQGLRMSS